MVTENYTNPHLMIQPQKIQCIYLGHAEKKTGKESIAPIFGRGPYKTALESLPLDPPFFVEWIAKTGHFLGYKISWKTTRLRVAKLSVWAGDVLQHLLGFRLHRKHHVFWIKVRGSTCWVEWARFWCGKDGGCKSWLFNIQLVGGFKHFLFSPRTLGKWSNSTNMFQMGWNHQPWQLFW